MRFAVVEFLCDHSCSVIQEAWLDETRKKCYFPQNKNFAKYIQKSLKQEKIQEWEAFEVIIIKHSIGTYDEAKNLARYTSEFGDTEGENFIRQQKEIKRKRAVYGDIIDLRDDMKKAKIDEQNEPVLVQSQVDETLNQLMTLENDAVESFLNPDNVHPETTNEVVFNVENVQIDKDSLILLEIKELVEKAKVEMFAKIELLMQEIQNINIRLGYSPLENFEKINSKKKFKEFVELMKIPQQRENMSQHLKSLPDLTNSNNPFHGKIATMLEFLFTIKFIKRLKWGEMNGRPPRARIIYLVNYKIFYKLGKALLDTATPKEVRLSFQVYFKHRAKNLIELMESGNLND